MSDRQAAMHEKQGDEHFLDELIDEIGQRLRRGEAIDVEQYAHEHPAFADNLQQMMPSLRALAELGHLPESKDGERSAGEASSARLGTLGDYQILCEIGRGGMGVVYEAEQISLGRRVALKVLPFAAVLDERQLTRFKNEAQAAAQLHHPNIVPVHAVGCERGVHYYAMQYIEGQTLAELIAGLRFAEGKKSEPGQASAAAPSDLAGQLASGRFAPPKKHAGSLEATIDSAAQAEQQAESSDAVASDTSPIAELSTKDATRQPSYFRTAARLGIQVAEALDYAHQHGIVHRDIKPSNLLLDSAGNPWVTDFGLALVEADPGLTMTGDIVGTLRYMSPEQALAKRVVIDHRTDVYSLGMTLYELLTLQPAFPGRDRQELLKQIAFEEPKAPTRINSAVPKDLETILLKATTKNPDERYATAKDLAEDLRRYLDDKPIKARRPSFGQLGIKWSRRHRGIVRAVAATFVIGAIIAGALLWRQRSQTLAAFARETEQRQLAQQNAQRANAEAQTARQVTDFLVGLFEGEDAGWMGYELGTSREKGENLTAREILDRGAKKVTSELNDRPVVQATLMDTIGHIYRSQGMLREAEPLLEKALAIRREHLGSEHLDVATSLNHLGWLRLDRLDPKAAELLFRQALAMRRKLLGQAHPLVAQSMYDLAWSLAVLGPALSTDNPDDVDDAERLFRQALAIRRKQHGNEHRDVAFSLSGLAWALSRKGDVLQALGVNHQATAMFLKLEGAENRGLIAPRFLEALMRRGSGDDEGAVPLFREALALARKHFGDEHVTVGFIEVSFAQCLSQRGDHEEAAKLYGKVLAGTRKLLGDEHPAVANNLWGLGNELQSQKKYEEAEKAYREALAIHRKFFDDDSRGVGNALHGLAWALSSQGDYDESEKLFRDALAIRRKLFGDDNRDVADTLNGLAHCLRSKGDYDESEKLYREELAIRRKRYGDESAEVARTLEDLAWSLVSQRKNEEAEKLFRDALAIGRELPRETDASVAQALNGLAHCLRSKGDYDESEKLYREALAIWPKLFGDDNPGVGHVLAGLAASLQAKGENEESEKLYREAAKIFRKHHGDESREVANTLNGLASSLCEQGKNEEALAIARKILGHQSAAMADFLYGLGGNLHARGKFKESEEVLRQALRIRRKVFGDESAEVAAALRGLATWALQSIQGKSLMAEMCLREALAINRNVFGDEHVEVGDTLHELSGSLHWQGRDEEAERVCREALAIRRKEFGDESREVATTLTRLAWSLHPQGKHEESEKRCREALWIFEKRSNRNDRWNSVHSYEFLGNLLRDTGRHEEAEDVYRSALAIWKELVAEAPTNFHARRQLNGAYNRLARIYATTDRQDEAEKLYREAMAIQRKLFGDESQRAANALSNLGFSLHEQGKNDEAEEAFREALAIRRKLFGDESQEVAGALSNLARSSLSPAGKHDEAEEAYREALAIHRKLFGDESKEVHDTYHWLARALLSQQKNEQALLVLSEAIELHPCSLMWQARGEIFAEQAQWDAAAADFAKATELKPESFTWYWRALAQLAAGERAGYRETCAAMLQQFAETENANIAHFASWSCVLAADATDDFSLPVQVAERALERDPENVFFLSSLGSVLYRAGRLDEALARLDEAESLLTDPSQDASSSPAYTWFFLAMTHHRLGHGEEAGQWLQKAAQWADDVLTERPEGSGVAWNRRLTLQLLRAEAEELLGGADAETTQIQRVGPAVPDDD